MMILVSGFSDKPTKKFAEISFLQNMFWLKWIREKNGIMWEFSPKSRVKMTNLMRGFCDKVVDAELRNRLAASYVGSFNSKLN